MHRTTILTVLAGVLAVAACTPSTGGQPTPAATPRGSAAATADVEATIKVLDFKLEPSTVSVTGSTLWLAVTNAGPTVHNVTVRDAAGSVLFGTADLREGESETIVRSIAPGEYIFFCSLAGHESLGIKGTLIVTAS